MSILNSLNMGEYHFTKTFSLANNILEQTVATITPVSASAVFSVEVKLDTINLTQQNTFRLKERIDGANDRTVNPLVAWVPGMEPAVMLGPISSGRLITITAQAAVLEGVARDIPVTIIYRARALPTVA